MRRIFADAPKIKGINGAIVRAAHDHGKVMVRASDQWGDQVVTIAMTPAQARAFAQEIVGAAAEAEIAAKETSSE